MFGSHVIVKSFCREADSLNTFQEYNEALYKSAWKANFLSGLIMLIFTIIKTSIFLYFLLDFA